MSLSWWFPTKSKSVASSGTEWTRLKRNIVRFRRASALSPSINMGRKFINPSALRIT